MNPAPEPTPPVSPPPSPSTAAEPAAEPKPLTPEEQFALFEKDLKENDWGHQPC
jgi:hypothetical protein